MKLNSTLFIILSNVCSLWGQSVTLDSSFGNSGIILGPFTSGISYANAIAQQADGKLVVAGYVEIGPAYDIFVARYNTDGTPDNSFGTNGFVVTNVGTSTDYANALIIQPDGKIVVAGDFSNNLSDDFVLIRYTTDGVPDQTFGTGGIVITDFDNNSGDAAHALAIQPDDKLIIAGWTFTTGKDIALLRYDANGILDPTFGNNGKVLTDINNQTQEANAIVLQPDGKIVVTGFSHTSSTFNDIVVLRYNYNGTLDTTFSNDGIVLPNINAEDDEGNAIALQPDGRIVVAGYLYNNSTYYDNLIMRFNTDGSPDHTFNSNGMVISDINGFDNWSNAIRIQPDGKIVTAGRAYSSDYDISLSRFNVNGSLDNTFGTNGHLITDILNDHDEALALIIQGDNKLVVSGFAYDSNGDRMVIVRYNNNLSTSMSSIASDNIKIYPSPVQDYLKVELPEEWDGIETTIEIYSLTSHHLYSSILSSPNNILNLSALSNGIYILSIKKDNGTFSLKTLISKIR